MYIPNHFRENDEKLLVDFIRTNNFATLVTTTNGQPFATHLPVDLEQSAKGLVIRGHIARANPQSVAIEEGAEALLIVQGPHAYVSPSWYTHRNVPTWNYMAVHLTGKLKPLDGDSLYAALKNLTDRYEDGRENRFSLEAMPGDFISGMMAGVTGFELSIERMEGNFKLSQNRNAADFDTIISRLDASEDPGARLVAEEMNKIKNKK